MPVDNDIGLFFRSLGSGGHGTGFDRAPRVVAVTGSNGKSTTAALIHHMLRASRRESQLAGNIGRGVLDIDPPGDGGVIVLELSSYQTELARALTPDVAVFTNLTPGSSRPACAALAGISQQSGGFCRGGPDRAVIGVDEPEGRYLANQLATGRSDDRVIRVSVGRKLSGPGWMVFVRKGFLFRMAQGQAGGVDRSARYPGPARCA